MQSFILGATARAYRSYERGDVRREALESPAGIGLTAISTYDGPRTLYHTLDFHVPSSLRAIPRVLVHAGCGYTEWRLTFVDDIKVGKIILVSAKNGLDMVIEHRLESSGVGDARDPGGRLSKAARSISNPVGRRGGFEMVPVSPSRYYAPG